MPVHTGAGIPLGERYNSSATTVINLKEPHQQSAFIRTEEHIGSIHLQSVDVSNSHSYTACAQHSCAQYTLNHPQRFIY